MSDPTVSTAPAQSRWRVSRIPPHIGPARTSTVILVVLFLAIGALYLYIRPETPGTTSTTQTGEQEAVPTTTTPAPTTAETTTPAPETTESEPTTTTEPTPTESTTPSPTDLPTETTAPDEPTDGSVPTTTAPSGTTTAPTTEVPPG
jgi:outer membrane biosynthesis protein TonB